jgi:hypothetical protein
MTGAVFGPEHVELIVFDIEVDEIPDVTLCLKLETIRYGRDCHSEAPGKE